MCKCTFFRDSTRLISHTISGAGSPETSTDHLCVRPDLIVTCLNVFRSMRGFSTQKLSHKEKDFIHMECLLVTKGQCMYREYRCTHIQLHRSNNIVCVYGLVKVFDVFLCLNIYYNGHLILYYNEYHWKPSNKNTYDSCACTDGCPLARRLLIRQLCCELSHGIDRQDPL